MTAEVDGVDVREARSVNQDLWLKEWKNCSYATPFQSPWWAEAWSESTDRKTSLEPVLLRLSTGLEVVLPISLDESVKGPQPRAILSPYGTYGGWLAKRALSSAEANAVADWLLSNYPELKIRLNPYDSPLQETIQGERREGSTQTLELTSGFEEIRQGWSKGHRYNARKAFDEGVKVRVADLGRDWEEYFEIYQETVKRWDDPNTIYPRELFSELSKETSEHVQLWLADHQGETVAGAILLFSDSVVDYWNGASLRKGQDVYAVNALLHDAIEFAVDGGWDWFDFNPSMGIEGVRKFKERFGTKTEPAPVVQNHTWVRSTWRRMRSLLS